MTTHRLSLYAALAAAVIALAGCATPVRNAALEDARIDVARARTEPAVASHAPEALRAAEDALARAESASQQWTDPAEVSRLANVARDRALLAQDLARQRVAAIRFEAEEAQRRAATAQAQAAQAQLLAEEARARAAAAAAAAAQIAPPAVVTAAPDGALSALAARPAPGTGTVITLDETLFEPGRSVLRPQALGMLDTLAAFLRDNTERVVVVEGFAVDFRGVPVNYTLSEQRTLAVRDALLARGIAGRRIEVRPFGTARSVAPGAFPRERIDIVVSDSAGRLAPR